MPDLSQVMMNVARSAERNLPRQTEGGGQDLSSMKEQIQLYDTMNKSLEGFAENQKKSRMEAAGITKELVSLAKKLGDVNDMAKVYNTILVQANGMQKTTKKSLEECLTLMEQQSKSGKKRSEAVKIESKVLEGMIRINRTLNEIEKDRNKIIDQRRDRIERIKRLSQLGKGEGIEGMAKSSLGKRSDEYIKTGKVGGGDVLVTTAYGIYAGITTATKSFMDGMQTTFSGGLAGLGKTVASGITKAVSFIGPKAGAATGSMLNLLVDTILFNMKAGITTRLMHQEAMAQYGNELKGNIGVHSRWRGLTMAEGQEQFGALSGVGGAVKKDMTSRMDSFLKIGKNMAMSAGETADSFDKAASFSSNFEDSASRLEDMFTGLQGSARGTNVNVKQISKGLLEAGVQARLLNMDFKQVNNIMNNMVANSKNLSVLGIDIKTQGADILKGLVTSGKKMGPAMAAFYGQKMYGESGDTLTDIGRFRLGKKSEELSSFDMASMSLKFKPGAGAQYGAASEQDKLMNQLKAQKSVMDDLVRQQPGGVKNAADLRGLADVAAQSENNILGLTPDELMTLYSQPLEDLAKDPKIQNRMKPVEDILSDLITIERHSEDIQEAISKLLQGLIAWLMLLPQHIRNALGKMPDEEKKLYEAATQTISGNLGSGSAMLNSKLKAMKSQGFDTSIQSAANVWGYKVPTTYNEASAKLPNQAPKNVKEAMENANSPEGDIAREQLNKETGMKRQFHSGGILPKGSLGLLQKGESISPDEFYAFNPNSSMNIIPKSRKSSNDVNSTTYTITIYGSPDKESHLKYIAEAIAG